MSTCSQCDRELPDDSDNLCADCNYDILGDPE